MTPTEVLTIFADVIAQSIETPENYALGTWPETAKLLDKAMDTFHQMKIIDDEYQIVFDALSETIFNKTNNIE